MIAGRDQCAAAQHGVVGLRFLDGDGAETVKAVGEGAGE